MWMDNKVFHIKLEEPKNEEKVHAWMKSGGRPSLTSDELSVGVLVDLGQVDNGACLSGVA